MKRWIKRFVLAGLVFFLALIALYLIAPNVIHEGVATIALDVDPVAAPITSRAAEKRALDKIAQIHTFRTASPKQQAALIREEGADVALSETEMNSYIVHRLNQARAGKLPKEIRRAIQDGQIRLFDGSFELTGNIDLGQIADYAERRFDLTIPEPYRRRRTVFSVKGLLDARDGQGQVVITDRTVGRIPNAGAELAPEIRQLVREVVSKTLIGDTLEATIMESVDGDTLRFKLPEGLKAVRIENGLLIVTRAPAR